MHILYVVSYTREVEEIHLNFCLSVGNERVLFLFFVSRENEIEYFSAVQKHVLVLQEFFYCFPSCTYRAIYGNSSLTLLQLHRGAMNYH